VCQGGIFIKSSDNENTLELLASFAYGRKKHLKKTFDPGEGLIGACFVEHETIYLTNIPDDYPEISSGLGGTQPKFVLMVPLKIDKLVLGVVELISLNEIKSHEIQFVEKISENIASSINTSQVANKTKRLLDEAKFRSEQLVTQEEEMGQNIEELHATQEESQRKEFETSAVLDILFNSTIIVELSLDGKIIFANKGFCNLLNTSLEKIQGLFYNALNQDASIQLLGEVIKGNKKDITSRIIFNGLEYYVKEHYAVTLNQYFEPAKVYVIIQDITEEVFAKKHMSK
jgi:PAS domain-containing protein